MLIMLNLILAIIILLVAVAAMYALFRAPAKTAGAALLLLIGGLVTLMAFTKQSQTGSLRSSESAVPTADLAVFAPSSSVWANLEHQQFLANVYPSKEAAAIPLARRIRAVIDESKLLGETESDGEDDVAATPESVVDSPLAEAEEASVEVAGASGARKLTAPAFLRLYDNSAGTIVQQKFASYLREEFPISEVRTSGQPFVPRLPPSKIETDGVRIVLTTEEEHVEVAASNSPLRQIQGKLVCEITTAKGAETISANYIDKSWVENLDQFVSTQPSTSFVVGYSTKLAASEAEARQMAVEDAIRNLPPQIASSATTAVVESLLVDRFAQKLSRPYGDVWREAILLDTSNERIGPFVVAAHRQAMAQQTQRTSLAMSLAILFAVAAGTCVLLNLLTQGYYRGPLFAGLVVVFGILMLVA